MLVSKVTRWVLRRSTLASEPHLTLQPGNTSFNTPVLFVHVFVNNHRYGSTRLLLGWYCAFVACGVWWYCVAKLWRVKLLCCSSVVLWCWAVVCGDAVIVCSNVVFLCCGVLPINGGVEVLLFWAVAGIGAVLLRWAVARLSKSQWY